MFDRHSGRFEEAALPAEVESALHAYRDSIPDFEGSSEFMPKLWTRIEKQQKVRYSFQRLASGFVTVAAGLCMMFSVALWAPPIQTSSDHGSTYVEVLADDLADDGGADSTAVL